MVIALDSFFQSIHPGHPYVVTKQSADWPHYEHRSDVDILCTNADDTTHLIELYLRLANPCEDVRKSLNGDRGRVDIFVDGDLDLRFDVYGSPPWSGVSPAFTEAVLKRAQRRGGARVPWHLHDLAIRLWEYTQYHEARPDKVKHLDYVRERWDPALVGVLSEWCSRPLTSYPTPLQALWQQGQA